LASVGDAAPAGPEAVAALGVGLGLVLAAGAAGGGGGGGPLEPLFGVVVDGYLRDALVYRDLDGSGTLDLGEPNVLSGADGRFNLRDLPGQGVLRARGGVDIATGEAFLGELIAPSNASVITPLTTLVVQYAVARNVSVREASKSIIDAFGLAAGTDLLNDDPIALAGAGDLDQLKAASQVVALMQLAAAAGGDPLAGLAAVQSLAERLAESGLDAAALLTDETELRAAFEAAGLTPDASANLAAAVAAVNADLAGATSLERIVATQYVVQGDLTVQATSNGEIDSDTISEAITQAESVLINGKIPEDLVKVVITDGTSGITNGPVTFTFTFSEAVVGFDVDKIVLLGGTVVGELAETLPGREFELTVQPADGVPSGEIDVSVQAGAVTSAVTGQGNEFARKKQAIDTVSPEAPVVSLTTDTGTSTDDALTNDATLTITAEAGSTVRVFDGDTELGIATEGAPGQFSFTPAGLADGVVTLTVTATDKAGNVSDAGEISFTLDTAAPAAPVVALANDTGTSNADGITTDAALSITAEADSTVRVFDGDTELGVATEGAPGQFSFTPTGLADGSYTLTATATDAAGNVSEVGEISFTLDTAAPAAPTVALTTDTGTSNDDALTNDAALTIAAEAGSTVRVFDGDTELGVATESAPGQFSFTPAGARRWGGDADGDGDGRRWQRLGRGRDQLHAGHDAAGSAGSGARQ
jgi:hypothetical protein